MGAVNLPFNIQDGDPLDPTAVMADFQAITSAVNGGLQAATNVTTASAVTQPGSANAEGVAATLARSDHRHVLQGFENLAADPTTGNFAGRCYFNTVSGKLRYCTNPAGSGTFADLTPDAANLIIHAAQHKDGGHDPLADNTITDHMKAAGTITAATIAADVNSISGTGWTTIQDLSVTTKNAQTLAIAVSLRFKNNDASDHTVGFRVQEIVGSPPVTTTIFTSGLMIVPKATGANQLGLARTFFYNTATDGARTFRVGAGADTGGQVDIVKGVSFNSETLTPVTIQVAVL